MSYKKFVFLLRRPPSASGTEAFDLALTAAAFDQEVQLILLDDAVYWLSVGLPDIVIEAIEQLGVERQSLGERGMAEFPLADFVTLHERAALGALIADADAVIGG